LYFNNYKSSREQQLLDDLTREAIAIVGEEMYYCPRTLNNYDSLYGADDQSSYTQAFKIPIYIENVAGFEGDGSFMSKFGIEVRDRITLSVSRTVFSVEVTSRTEQYRPNEGDLIYFPLNNKCFQIKFVDKFEMFYPLGSLYTWKMQCELFEYSDEKIATGIPEIDSLQTKYNTDIASWAITTEEGAPIINEVGKVLVADQAPIFDVAGDDTNKIAEESNNYIDFSQKDPFSEGNIGNIV